MPKTKTEIKLSLAECKQAIAAYLQDYCDFKEVNATNVEFIISYESADFDYGGTPHTNGCTAWFEKD